MDKNKLEEIVKKVLVEYDLKILYNMSTSGDFIVKQCVNNVGVHFILKIRKRKSDRLRQQFINEIFINIFLEQIEKENFPYEVIYHNIGESEETLLYKMIEGHALNGYYFLIGKRKSINYNPRKIVQLISLIQKQGDKFIIFNNNINLEKMGYEYTKKYLSRYEDIYDKYFGKDYLLKLRGFIKNNKKLLDENLVLSHGDLNPKNIIINNDNKMTFIDWTDIRLNNPLSDIARLYLASWNLKTKQKELKRLALKSISSNEILFHLNILILTGRFIKIINDSYKGTIEDFENGSASKETRNKMLHEVKRAKEATVKTFRDSFNYLSNSYINDKNLDDIINNFSDKKFVIGFLNKNKKRFDFKNTIKDLELNIHFKRHKDHSKRLIVTYIFNDDGLEKRYTAKIRFYKGKNLANKSWFMSNIIWNSITDGDKYIAKPIYYFDDYGLFIYKTALGNSFGNLLKKGDLSEEEKVNNIIKATKYLAELHRIDISNLEKKSFLKDNGVFTYINFAEKLIKDGKNEYEVKTSKIIKIIKKEISKYSGMNDSLIHGDFQIENFIFNGADLKFIDFDDSEINDPLVDVGNFLVQIFYGGLIGNNVQYYRELILSEYLKYNDKLNRKHLNERLNLYIIVAKLKNISQKVIKTQEISMEELSGVSWDLIQIERRLTDLKADPLNYFKQ